MSQAKGWLSGALKTMANKLDGGAVAGGGAAPPASGFHGVDVEAERRRRRWDAAQSGLFGDDGSASRVDGSGARVGSRRRGGSSGSARGGERGFYDDVESSDSGGSERRSSCGDSDEFPMAKRAGANTNAPPRSADAFASSVQGLASNFGGQANLGGFYSDED